MTIRIGILGYGNLGRGVEAAIARTKDLELAAVFTRRDPKDLQIKDKNAQVVSVGDIANWTDKIDVLINCGGSATDLPVQTPQFAKTFNIIDSFDTHANIPTHFENVDKAAKEGGKLALISCGWDPGLFSLARIYAGAIVPDGEHYTFWGKGVSQGHSDAIRRLEGVKDARQYTVPIDSALDAVRKGEKPTFTARQMHLRECYVVAEEGADKAKIEEQIKTMPNYFADYDTTVTFITQEEMDRAHAGLPHGGFVLRSADIGYAEDHHKALIEFSLKLDSNPEFTASVLAAYARAVARLAAEGRSGCITVFDVAPAYLSPADPAELRAHLL